MIEEKYTIRAIIDNLGFEVKDYQEIKAGFSTDKKYRLETSGGLLLVRISDINKAKNRKNEFEIIEKAYNNGIKCNQTVKFAELIDFGICFSCFRYIEGSDAEKVLPTLSDDIAFSIGVAAGKDLKKLNSIMPSQNIESWAERKIQKHKLYEEKYNNLGYSFIGDREIFEYINANIDLMKDTKNVFQHDDFHVGNIIICNNQYNGIIDFNRMDWGDYAHDFVKLGWFSRYVSAAFANGQITGYFGNSVPEDFWKRYSLYMAMSVFSTIVWHMEHFPNLMNKINKYLDVILDDHNYFKNQKPKWKN